MKKKNGHKQRCYSHVVKLLVPHEKWVPMLLEYKAIKIIRNENGKERFKAMHRTKHVHKSDIEILSAYNAEIRSLYNYYSLANDAYKIGKLANVMKYSLFKTFTNKYKTNVHRIKDRYFKGNQFTVEYPAKSGLKQSVYLNKGFKRKKEAMSAEVSPLPRY